MLPIYKEEEEERAVGEGNKEMSLLAVVCSRNNSNVLLIQKYEFSFSSFTSIIASRDDYLVFSIS